MDYSKSGNAKANKNGPHWQNKQGLDSYGGQRAKIEIKPVTGKGDPASVPGDRPATKPSRKKKR